MIFQLQSILSLTSSTSSITGISAALDADSGRARTTATRQKHMSRFTTRSNHSQWLRLLSFLSSQKACGRTSAPKRMLRAFTWSISLFTTLLCATKNLSSAWTQFRRLSQWDEACETSSTSKTVSHLPQLSLSHAMLRNEKFLRA